MGRGVTTGVAVFMIIMGIGVAGIWTKDIITRTPEIDWTRGVLKAREKAGGSLLLPHWLAEYGTAVILLVGAAGLLSGSGWGLLVGLVGLGALLYTSTNSLGWVLARRERYPYGVPMLVAALGAVASVVLLLL
jgi:hypothetical protein